jgi:hypothetical protein
MNTYLQALNQLKIASQVNNETIADLLNHQLTAEQVGLALQGVGEFATPENLSLVEKALLNACMQPIERLKRLFIEIKTIQASIKPPNISA